jgi:hypothetical protein
MDTEFVWLFICYGVLILGPFMIPVVHASIDAVKTLTRGLHRNLVERPDGNPTTCSRLKDVDVAGSALAGR